MSILARFKDIMSSNIHALLDKAEDPEKMIDQYLRNLDKDLRKVKSETATVMAEEQRAKREWEACRADMEKMERYAIKALEAGNEDDARKFLERKAVLKEKYGELEKAFQLAASNATQMRQMHDKLVSDIKALESRRNMLKAKWSVAKTQQRLNELGAQTTASGSTIAAFNRMEEKVNQALDKARAMAELNKGPEDDIEELMKKYDTSSSSPSVDAELAALKERIKKKEE